MFFACHTNYDKVWLRPGVVLDLLYTASKGGEFSEFATKWDTPGS